MSAALKYRVEIDGLRSIAVLPVILYHAGLPSFSGGFLGVDIFFVISGYLITTILVREMNEGGFSLVKFYERRARRILPALYFLIVVVFILGLVILSPKEMADLGGSIWSVSLFVSNIFFWQSLDYFGPAAEQQPLLHTWTLAIEEQYYFIFPLFLLFFWRRNHGLALALVVAVTVVSLMLSHFFSEMQPSANFYLLPTRAWELFLGSILAILQFKGLFTENGKKFSELMSSIGMSLIFFSLFYFDSHTPFPSFYTLIPTIGTLLVLAYSDQSHWVKSFLSLKPLVFVGLVSYSAYLWHQPIIALYLESGGALGLAASVVITLLTIAIAYFSWAFIEAPFRDKARVSARAIFQFSVAAILASVFVGGSAHIFNGFESVRGGARYLNVMEGAVSSPLRENCHGGGRTGFILAEEGCEYFSSPPNVAVIGDSHSVELSYELGRVGENHGVNVKQFSASGCPPVVNVLPGKKEEKCAKWLNSVLAYIADSDIEHIVVAFRFNLYLSGDTTNYVSNDAGNAIESNLNEIIDFLVSKSKKVIVVSQAPELPDHIEKLAFSGDWDEVGLRALGRSEWNSMNLELLSILSPLKSKVSIIDPTDYFCSSEWCYAYKDGETLYFDDDHMSLKGGELVALNVLAEMEAH